jgi:hypothetical protein
LPANTEEEVSWDDERIEEGIVFGGLEPVMKASASPGIILPWYCPLGPYASFLLTSKTVPFIATSVGFPGVLPGGRCPRSAVFSLSLSSPCFGKLREAASYRHIVPARRKLWDHLLEVPDQFSSLGRKSFPRLHCARGVKLGRTFSTLVIFCTKF